MQPIWMTLVFPIKDEKVLLGKKVRKIGMGKWNGWGGKVEAGETIRNAAVREFQAESGLIAEEKDLQKAAMCTFINSTEDGREIPVKVVVFLVLKWQGELVVNNEMEDPTWFPTETLPPQGEFIAADPHWLPFVLRGHKLIVLAKYDPDFNLIEEPIVHFVPQI